MRIGFGSTVLARCLAQGGVDGIGSYTRELMQRMAQMPDVALHPYAFAGPMPIDMGADLVNAGDFQRQALLSLAAGQPFSTLQQVLATKVDLVHATDHYIPRLRGVPVIATLMDAIPLAHPEWVDYRFKRLKNELWRRSAHWAQHIVTISQYSKIEIGHWFSIPENRISVIPLGVDERWFSKPAAESLERVRRHYQLPDRFFLSVGTLQPRKNIGTLIAAHRMLPKALRYEVPLVVAGKAGWGCNDILTQLKHVNDGSLRWLNYVPDEDILPLLQQATALVFPSLHEGFGLPVLEAFAAQIPVIASNTTALPEVVGDAGLLVDPLKPGIWAEAMRYVATDVGISAMRLRGLNRAKDFTWDKTSMATRQAYFLAYKRL